MALIPYFAAIWSVVLLAAIGGAVTARRMRSWWAGTLTGAWSGLVSGLIGLICMQVLAVTAMPVLRRDPQNLAEFHDAADLPTAITGDFLAGGINHLVVVGVIICSILASIGAAVGLAVAHLGRMARRPAQAASASAVAGQPPAENGR